MAERYQCFLLERVNERTWREPCDDEDCEEGSHECYSFDARRADTGEVIGTGWSYMERAGLPAGAMWWQEMGEESRPSGPRDWADRSPDELARMVANAREHPEWYPRGVDAETGIPFRSPTYLFESGEQLHVMTPGGPWNIDSRASNCGLPFDYAHRCWVRHGEPPDVTVDKNGETCDAGAGSIRAGDYHGFLRAGWLEP